MKNNVYAYIAIGIAVIAVVVSIFAFKHNSPPYSTTPNTVLQKVLASGTLRVGYIVYPPYIIQDPKTGALSGIFYDLTNALGVQLGLKVQWVQEAGYGTIFTSLDDNRYDVYGGGLWANSTRAEAGQLTVPAFYNTIYAYARTDDHRFDNNLSAINSPSVRISAIDGTAEDTIAKTDYPNAQEVSLPQTSPFDQEPLQVTSGKADVDFIQSDVAALFLKANPGTLRQVSTQPLRIYGNSYAVKFGETDLYQMLDVAIQEAISNGTVDKILTKYESSPTDYLHVAPPYTSN